MSTRMLAISGIAALLGLVSAALLLSSLRSQSPEEARCGILEVTNFSDVSATPIHVTIAVIVNAAEGAPAYCRVRGYVDRDIGIELRLPVANWNNKFLEIGCGGYCGSTGFISLCEGPLRKGYACIATDTGHRSTTEEASWAESDQQARMDWAIRATHLAAVAGKAIVSRYYGRLAQNSYFCGRSTGGHQAISEAQRYPYDFNGIIAGAPPINYSENTAVSLWIAGLVLGSRGPPLTKNDLELAHDAVLAKCDLDDGVADRVVGNPTACKFDPEVLLCSPQRRSGCLDRAKVTELRRIYEGPTTSKGLRLYPGGALPGSELNWLNGGMDARFSYEYFRHVAFQPKVEYQSVNRRFEFERFGLIDRLKTKLTGVLGENQPAPVPDARSITSVFDFDRDFQRLSATDFIYSAADPDLHKFKAANGKLIAYQGWQDVSGVPEDIINYYHLVEKTMGGPTSTRAFFRLFMVPGMGHCSGGDGAFAVDYLSYLEAWVEHGKTPDRLIGGHIDNLDWYHAFTLRFPLAASVPITFTRPLYPYPLRAVYKRAGNPSDASNFVAEGP